MNKMKDVTYLPVCIKGDVVIAEQFPDFIFKKNQVNIRTLDNGVTVIECEIVSYNPDGTFNFMVSELDCDD